MYALDRFVISSTEYQIAVYPSKVVFGVCIALLDGTPSFSEEKSVVLLEKQFVRFIDILIKLISTSSSTAEKLEVDFSNLIRPQQKVTLITEKNQISLTISSGDFNFVIVENKPEISAPAKSLIKAFSNLVLKSFCYSPLITRDLIQIVNSLDVCDLEEKKEKTLCARLDNVPDLSVNKYLLSELIFRHQKLLVNIKRLQLLVIQKAHIAY